MSLASRITGWAERTALPDRITRAGIDLLCGRTARRLARLPADADADFARGMAAFPIAEHADAANAQHYELPAHFFDLCLGARRKYSCCFYPAPDTSLDEAEEHALAATLARAGLADGQDILELGCGWGSFTLYAAERLPGARITAVSNSHGQRAHIEAAAAARGLTNVRIVIADMNAFEAERACDRIVSVEMFEHMANWEALLGKARSWLKSDGRLFIHIFTHKSASYRFDHRNPSDWIAQHFFTGGIMPSHQLIRRFGSLFEVEEEWRWDGSHYRRTADHWLGRYDARIEEIRPLLAQVYGPDARLWERRWRLFFLATSGLFGFDGGKVWGVSHYRLRAT